MIQVVADISGVDLEVQAATDEKMPHMYMKVSDGSILTYPEAIIKHIARMNLSSGLIGKTAFDQAKDDEWITWCQTAWALPAHSAVCQVYGKHTLNNEKFNADVKAVKEHCKVFDSYLKGKKWISGDTFSLADIWVGTHMSHAF